MTRRMQYASQKSKLGKRIFEAMQLPDHTGHGRISQTIQKCHISEDNTEARCKHTHRLWHLFTYYVLPFKKDTLLSLCPLEEPGWEGLKVICLTPQPGEE